MQAAEQFVRDEIAPATGLPPAIHLLVDSENIPAQKLYKKLGYKLQVGYLDIFYQSTKLLNQSILYFALTQYILLLHRHNNTRTSFSPSYAYVMFSYNSLSKQTVRR
jgi:hypothetical protein